MLYGKTDGICLSFVLGMLAIYVGLSVCQIYPFGHGGIIGGRLSLFMSVFFLYNVCKWRDLSLR